MFYETCFRFRLLKKSNASEFASSFFLQFKVLPLPQKFNRFHRFQFPLPYPWYNQYTVIYYTRAQLKGINPPFLAW